MKLRVLGCSGSIGGSSQRTTAFLLDDDILIDAGTGIGDLSLDELAAVDHVFLTHAHLDHIAALPLMLDAVADRRRRPLNVYGVQGVIDSLRQHIFNDAIWPDFSSLPSADTPFLRYRTIAIGQPLQLAGRTITALPACHTVPAVGYQLDSGAASLVFSGDTGPCPAFWQAVNGIPNLRHLIVECAFPNQDRLLAEISQHLCPAQLASELQQLVRPCHVYITHLKPGQAQVAMAEIIGELGKFAPQMLCSGQVLEF